MMDDFAELSDDTSRWLGEKYRVIRIFNVKRARSGAFVNMFPVIDAEHDYILLWNGNRRNHFSLIEPYYRTRSGEFLLLRDVFSGDKFVGLTCNLNCFRTAFYEGLHARKVGGIAVFQKATIDLRQIDDVI